MQIERSPVIGESCFYLSYKRSETDADAIARYPCPPPVPVAQDATIPRRPHGLLCVDSVFGKGREPKVGPPIVQSVAIYMVYQHTWRGTADETMQIESFPVDLRVCVDQSERSALRRSPPRPTWQSFKILTIKERDPTAGQLENRRHAAAWAGVRSVGVTESADADAC